MSGSARHASRRVAAGTALAGAATLGYAWAEARWFTLRRVTLPVLPPGAPELTVLHISDLHLAPYQRRKRAWVASLAALEPDLVVDTGDNLGHRRAVPALLDDLGELTARPGLFVLGSNDYYEPSMRNPFAYLLPDDGTRRTNLRQLPWRELVAQLEDRGWTYVANRRATVEVKGVRIAVAGVDDPHLYYDDLPAVAGPADQDADLRLGIAHAPYLRVLERFSHDGYDAILAGHTHGGQVCLPWAGALVTNCDLDVRRASGLSRHPAGSEPGDPQSSWLHVSAGAGTSPYVPLRFFCRPEATLLRLVPRPDF